MATLCPLSHKSPKYTIRHSISSCVSGFVITSNSSLSTSCFSINSPPYALTTSVSHTSRNFLPLCPRPCACIFIFRNTRALRRGAVNSAVVLIPPSSAPPSTRVNCPSGQMYRIRNEASSPLVLSLSPVLQSKATAVRSLFFFAIYYSHTATFLSRSSYLSLKGLIRFSVPMTLAELIDSRREQHLAELNEFLRIPSVSAKSEHKPDIERAARWVADNLRSAGFESIEIVPTALHPLVYAESLNAPGKPTVLFYGHYDVQPAEPLHLWTTPAFEPTVRNGNIYARGTADDKGQVHIHLKALQALHELAGKFPINVKILIEGEEEVGSVSLWNFVQKNKEKLKADALVVSDTSM